MKRAACFLDRDGTLIENRHYARTPEEIVLLPGAAEAVALLNGRGVAAVLITNQSGIGRGYFTADDLAAQHERLATLLAGGGARLDGIYVCPHAPDSACACRKPGTELVERAASELELDLARSWVVGDGAADIELGRRATAGAMLVGSGWRAADSEVARQVTEAVAAATGTPPSGIYAGVLDAVQELISGPWSDLPESV